MGKPCDYKNFIFLSKTNETKEALKMHLGELRLYCGENLDRNVNINLCCTTASQTEISLFGWSPQEKVYDTYRKCSFSQQTQQPYIFSKVLSLYIVASCIPVYFYYSSLADKVGIKCKGKHCKRLDSQITPNQQQQRPSFGYNVLQDMSCMKYGQI